MKFSGYCFYMNTNIWGDFQICISLFFCSDCYYNLSAKPFLEVYLGIQEFVVKHLPSGQKYAYGLKTFPTSRFFNYELTFTQRGSFASSY